MSSFQKRIGPGRPSSMRSCSVRLLGGVMLPRRLGGRVGSRGRPDPAMAIAGASVLTKTMMATMDLGTPGVPTLVVTSATSRATTRLKGNPTPTGSRSLSSSSTLRRGQSFLLCRDIGLLQVRAAGPFPGRLPQPSHVLHLQG